MKKIYIAGAGGMLGDAFYKIFKNNYDLKCTDIDVNSDWLSFLDFRDRDSYERDVIDFSPDYLFHLGAYTNLEFCELNPDKAYITNTLSVENEAIIGVWSEGFFLPLGFLSICTLVHLSIAKDDKSK